jgi:hypothetical protein
MGRHGSNHPLHAVELIQQVVSAESYTCQQVVMPAEILGSGMDNDIYTELQRLNIVRCGQCGIDNSHYTVLLGDFYHRRDVQHTQIGIGR